MSRLTRYAVLAGAGLSVLVASLSWRRSAEPQATGVPTPVSAASVKAPWRAAREQARDQAARTRAFELAARDGSSAAATWLIEEARSDSPLAAQAAAALGRIDATIACEALTSTLGTASPLVRGNALRAVGNAGGCGQAGLLARFVGDRSQPTRVRQEAALALAKSHDPSAAPTLLTALRSVASDAAPLGEQLRLTLIQALGATGSPEGRAFLAGYARTTRSTSERAFAGRYL